MQCALKATLQSAWWKIQHLILTHKTTDYPPPDLGNTSYTNGPKGDDNEKQQITLTQYGNCSMEGKGGLETAQKNLALSRFRIQLKATPPALSLLHVFVLAARCLWRCQILVLNNCHVYQNTIALFFFTSHSNPASMAPGSLYVAGAAAGNCGWTGARGGPA